MNRNDRLAALIGQIDPSKVENGGCPHYMADLARVENGNEAPARPLDPRVEFSR